MNKARKQKNKESKVFYPKPKEFHILCSTKRGARTMRMDTVLGFRASNRYQIIKEKVKKAYFVTASSDWTVIL